MVAAAPLDTVVHELPSVDVCTSYAYTGIPPTSDGGNQLNVNTPFPDDDVTPVGAAGNAAGVTTVIALGKPVPTEFTALTRKMYDTPFVRPVAVNVFAVGVAIVVHVDPPLLERSTT